MAQEKFDKLFALAKKYLVSDDHKRSKTIATGDIEKMMQALEKEINSQFIDKQIAESQLLEVEKKYSKTLEEIQDYAIISLDINGNIENWSKTAEKIKGYTATEIIGQNFRIFYTDKDKYDRVPEKLLKEALKNGVAKHEGWRVRKNGTRFWGNITIATQYDSKGNATGFNKLTRDLSILKKSENSIKLITERFKQATEAAKIGIWDWDVVNNKLTWDDIMYELYGITHETFGGAYEAWKNGLHPEDVERGDEEIQLALEGKKPFDTTFRVVWPDGSIHYIKGIAKVKRDSGGRAIQMIGTNWDITAQKENEILLHESNERNKAFVEQAPFAIAMFDTEMRYLAASNKWRRDYALEERDIIGKSHYEIFPEIGEDWKEIHRQCLKGAINKTDGTRFKRADDSEQWITWDVRPWYLTTDVIGGLLMYTDDITEQKDIEKGKARTDEILDNASQVARIGVWEVDLRKGKMLWDNMTKQIHEVDRNYEPTLETGINFYKEGESRERIQKIIDKAIKSRVPWDEELELVTAKGKELWVRAIGQVEFDGDECVRLYGIFQDISEQKKIQQELRISVEQFRGAFEYSAIGMALVSTDGKWLKVNKQLCNFLGYTEPELFELTFQDITHPEDLESDLLQVQRALKGKIESYQMEKRYFHKNGSVVWVLLSVSLVRDQNKHPLHFVAQIENITKRKKAEQELQRINQELTAILDSGHVSIIGTDILGNITHFNDGAEELLGYKSEEMVRKQTPAIVHSEKEVINRGIELTKQLGKEVKGFDVFIELPKSQKYESRKWTYVRKDGTTFPVQLVVTAIRNETNEIVGFLGIATDISELEASRQDLRITKDRQEVIMSQLTKQNEQLARFAHITSHNLRSPVSNLNSILHLYKGATDEDDKLLIFSKFEKVIAHLSETLNELIEALKIQEDVDKERENVSISKTVEKIEEILAGEIINTKGKIITDFSEVDTVHYNRGYLESIIQNLISNAIKYKSPDRAPQIHMKTKVKGDQILLTVEDNGLGIDMEKNGNRLFGLHKTFHRHPDAKGVGLFLVKTQIEAMGGKISADSEVGKGTIFKITFNSTV